MTDQRLHPWTTVVRQELLDRRPWIAVWDETVQLPDGRVIEHFTTLEMPSYVVVVAITPDQQVVVERSYKHGPRRVSLHIPAGGIEPGEAPLAAAQRELREETGYAAPTWHALGGSIMHGNRGGGTAHVFVALDATRVAEPDTDDLEEMVIELHPLASLMESAIAGEFSVICSVTAIAMAVAAISTKAGPFRESPIDLSATPTTE